MKHFSVGMMRKGSRRGGGFTIVELLIVIVVIAILAAITIVAYNGIQNRSKDSAVQTTLSNYARKLETYRYATTNSAETYPATLADAGITATSNVTVNYKVVSGSNFYCIDGQNGSSQYFVSSLTSKVAVGLCPPIDSLAGWWPLDGNTKNMATGDTSAVAVGVTSSDGQDGRPNGSYTFSGDASNSYIDTKHISSRTRFTASLWVYPTANSGYRTPLSEARDCCGSGYRGIDLKTSYGSGMGSVSLWAGGGGSAASASGTTALPLNGWTLITATYDGSSISYYENGTLVQSNAYNGDPGTPINTLMIGRAGAVAAGAFAGRVDDVRIYTRALTATEIQNLYQIGAF